MERIFFPCTGKYCIERKMMDNTVNYDNPTHWKQLHRRFGSSLKSVGRSGLSETYNQYKYLSEEQTFVKAIQTIQLERAIDFDTITVLDIGAGTGYWLHVINDYLISKGKLAELTAFDLSNEAIEQLKKTIPKVKEVIENAGTVDCNMFGESFDFVMSNYCLHHITNTKQFLNALNLAVQSVKPGGYLLLMDCLIDRKYSPYYTIDPETYAGSGLSRPIKMVDEVCEKKGLSRILMVDPISYLMNNVLEDDTRVGYKWKQIIWRILHKFYKSDLASKVLVPVIFLIDKLLKNKQKGFSTRLVIYQKRLK